LIVVISIGPVPGACKAQEESRVDNASPTIGDTLRDIAVQNTWGIIQDFAERQKQFASKMTAIMVNAQQASACIEILRAYNPLPKDALSDTLDSRQAMLNVYISAPNMENTGNNGYLSHKGRLGRLFGQ
jgi:hypothetical protein